MRFLWQSNAPWAGTGYGAQTKLMLRQLLLMGHEPHCFCFYGLHGGRVSYDGYTCWPNSDYNEWGNDVIQAHTERSEAEAVVTLMDLMVLRPDTWRKLKVPWLAWVPIDSDGIGAATMQPLEHVDYPVAMSDFGFLQMQEAGVEPAARIYHAVDTNIFKPVTTEERTETRQLLQLDEDAYVVGMVMANKGNRKHYPLQLQAVRKWMDENPDRKVQVYIHCDPTHMMGGWDMPMLVEKLGLRGHVYCTNQYDTVVVPASPQFLRRVYGAFDVLMNVSAGEGFGIPILEAQACGVPVITGNYTAMPEVTYYGYTVEAESRDMANHYGWQFIPSIEDMVYKLECVYRMDHSRAKAQAVAFVQRNFDVPVIAPQWNALLETARAAGKRAGRMPAQLPKDHVLEPALD